MIVNVAEQLRQHSFPLHVQSDVIFVRHSDAAMHLYAFAHGKVGDACSFGLCDRDIKWALLMVAVDQGRSLERRRTGNFDLAVKMCGAMLECLEFADQLAELLAL